MLKRVVLDLILAVGAALGTFSRSRADLGLEILALRQQLWCSSGTAPASGERARSLILGRAAAILGALEGRARHRETR